MKIWSYIQSGGPIMYVLLIMNIIGLAIIINKYFSIASQRKVLEPVAKDILDRLGIRPHTLNEDSPAKLELIKDGVTSFMHQLEAGMDFIKTIASVAPLLGLLGTVVGVLSAFHTIAEHGLKNPTLFAGGISMALITTAGGLIVAIPHHIFYNHLASKLNSLEVELEEMTVKTGLKGKSE